MEILADCDLNLLKETKILLEKSMSEGAAYITKSVPMPASAVISKVWEH